MGRIVRPHSVTALPIANVAIPTTLILLVLVVGGLITGGALFALVYLFRTFASDGDGGER